MYGLAKCALLACVAVVTASGFNLGPQDIVFHLLTRNNPSISEPLLPDSNAISLSVFFNPTSKTIFTIHGHNDSVGGNFNAFLVPAHLQSEDVNFIGVDWSVGATFYTEGLANAPQVGERIASFINILIDSFAYDVNQIRIVGVGLGGHIAGIAARNVNANVPHIVAIDPSLVGWTHNPNILKADDAGVVEVIHATAGVFGYDYPLGDLDFYPNGGSQQTGCGPSVDCSHTYAIAFYAESLTAEVTEGDQFVGTACESYEQAIVQQCSGERDAVFGGSATKTTENGIYTFQTNISPPFARG